MKIDSKHALRKHIPRGRSRIAKSETETVAHQVKNSCELVKPDIMARLKMTWGNRIFSANEVAAMRADEVGEA